LPELPDEKENNSTLLGIDSNGNGVRDDLEILTVKEFGNDRDIVEVVFAGVRRRDYSVYIYMNNLINYNSIEKIIKDGDITVDCFIDMTGDYSGDDIIYYKYYNTPERKKVEKAIIKGLGGHIDRGREITKEFCEKGIEESKT